MVERFSFVHGVFQAVGFSNRKGKQWKKRCLVEYGRERPCIKWILIRQLKILFGTLANSFWKH